MKKLAVLIVIGAVLSGLTGCSKNEGLKILAFCGSASMPVLEEAAVNFEKKTGIKVELHFSGSGTMLSQLKISKKGDLYIPGSPDYMIKAIDDGVVYPDTVKRLAYLVPAIITPKGNPKDITSLEDLAKGGVRVGIGSPESVCVGEYAVEVLKNNGLYEKVGKNIVVHVESCSKTASLPVLGTVDAIIGWRVFHFWNPEKTEVVYIKPERIPRISFIPGAIAKYTNNRKEAKQFLDYLAGPAGNSIFQKYNYIATEKEARQFAPNATISAISPRG